MPSAISTGFRDSSKRPARTSAGHPVLFGPAAPPALPAGVTMEDVTFTAKQRGMTPEQVIEALRKKQSAP